MRSSGVPLALPIPFSDVMPELGVDEALQSAGERKDAAGSLA
jgi:hypothetical protein